MGLVFLLVIGGLLGWVAAIIMRAETRRGIGFNVAAGIAGALVAGLVIGPMIGRGNLLEGTYSVDGLLVAFAGTVGFLFLVNLFRGRDGSLND
jgi:uncharacterized membrane protein YeaQ/YmgE (transglycosylase-associated protein family)